MIADLHGQTALIVSARPPLAQALGEAFDRHGATCVHASASEVEPALAEIRGAGRRVDALICGSPSSAAKVTRLEDYTAETASRAIATGAMPAFDSLQRIRAALDRWPRYVVALSSRTPDRFAPHADFSAASEAALETLVRFASERLAAEEVRMNVLRYRLAPQAEAERGGRLFATPQEVANAAVALCSGLLDSMRGQVLTVDRGASFSDNVFRQFERQA